MASEKNNGNVFLENMTFILSPENFQKYILGSKKNGQPRAIYDIVKDYTSPKKKGKKKKKKNQSDTVSGTYAFYLDTKKKKKGKKKKHWHI